MLIVLENRELDDVMNNSATPELNALARRYALLNHYEAVGHGFQNSFALISGSDRGIPEECADCSFASESIVDALEKADPLTVPARPDTGRAACVLVRHPGSLPLDARECCWARVTAS